MAEYPRPHLPGETIAYYPIPRDENQLLYAKYAAAAQAEFPLICFAGGWQTINITTRIRHALARERFPRSLLNYGPSGSAMVGGHLECGALHLSAGDAEQHR